MTPLPKLCLSKLKTMLPNMVKGMVHNSSFWMRKQIRELTAYPESVDEFVQQIKTLEYVEDNFQDIKDQLDLSD